MKKLLGILTILALLCLCACALADVAIDEKAFPDATFRTWVREYLDPNGDGVLSDAECNAVTAIEIAQGSDTHELFLSSLEGIAYFPHLQELTCRLMPVTGVDLSRNTELTYVCFAYCQITQLDVSMLSDLTTLIVNKDNHDVPGLTALDVTHNPKLQVLSLHFNDLKALDLGSCPALTELGLNGNAIEHLDLSGHSSLDTVYCTDSALKTVDLTGCSALTYLNCNGSKLEALDVSPCPTLESLFLLSNQLDSLDLSASSKLVSLSVINNPLTSLKLAPSLLRLYAYSTALKSLDLRGCPALLAVAGRTPTREYDADYQCNYLLYKSSSADLQIDEGTRLITDDSEPEAPTAATVGALKYSLDGSEATVTGPKSKNAKKLTIPATIKVEGKTYKVTEIKANAFKGMKKLTTVVIGKNVKTIGKNVFYKCAKLKSITIKTTKLTTKTVGANAFKGVYKKATVQVPAKKLKAYKTLLVKKGLPKTAKVKK